MYVTVLFFASAREAVGSNSVCVNLPDKSSNVSSTCVYCVQDVLQNLLTKYPELERVQQTFGLLYAVNEEYATSTHPIHHKDEIALFPPVSGG